MARISVNEKDVSWYTRQGTGPLTIYMVGVSNTGPIDRPVLCNSIYQFKRTFGGPVRGLERSYNMASSFVTAGASVLFQRVVDQDCSVNYDRSEPYYSKANIFTEEVDPSADPPETPVVVDLLSKYPGEFLNGYTVTCAWDSRYDHQVANFHINDLSGNTVEVFAVNFSDKYSEKYYTNEDLSDYVVVSIAGPFVNGQDIDLPSTAKTFSGGCSFVGNDYSDVDVVSSIVSKNPSSDDESVFNLIKDPYLYDFDIVITSGFATVTGVAPVSIIDQIFASIVSERGTAIYLVDGMPGQTPAWYVTYCGNPEFDSSYFVAVGPWCYAKFINNGEVNLLPGSYSFLIAWIKSCSEGVPVWMAPAGVKRASLGSFFIKPEYEIGKAVMDMWQPNPSDFAPNAYSLNPIIRAKNYGYVIYGNSTLLHNSAEGEISALQQVSTRVVANIIKRKAFDVALSLQFDQMSSDLYAQFRTLMSVTLDELKYKGAIFDYRILMDDANVSIQNLNERKLPVKILISPAPAVENFDITLEITKAGVTFSEGGEVTTDTSVN